jgi:single-strand DNA-binding protein
MSKSINRVFLMGHLGQKPELKTSRSGRPFTRLNLATARYRGPDSEDSTDWHSVFVFGDEAERCAKWLDKGALVFVDGSLNYWKSEAEQPEKRYQNAISADRVNFITYGRHLETVDNSGTPRNHNAVAHL